MIFRQPNNLSRVMSQVLDRLEQGRTLTLEFADEAEATHGLLVLHEIARQRTIGVVITPIDAHAIELRKAVPAA